MWESGGCDHLVEKSLDSIFICAELERFSNSEMEWRLNRNLKLERILDQRHTFEAVNMYVILQGWVTILMDEKSRDWPLCTPYIGQLGKADEQADENKK